MSDKVTFKIQLKTETGDVVTAIADAKQLADGIVKVNKEFQNATKSLSTFAQTSLAVDAVTNLVGKLNSQLQKLATSFNSFDKSMRAANTMVGKSGDEFNHMKEEISDLSKVVPLTREELAQGLYAVASNGYEGAKAMEVLAASARSAVGGMADLSQVIGVTATITKNYKDQNYAIADVQDKIQLTAKMGVTSFEQLAAALPRVTGNAATLGVSLDELLGTFATLTGVSGNTAEVSTQLGAIFTALVKPSSEASKVAEDMGIQFDAAAIKAAGGFQEFLAQLDACVKEYAASSGTLEQEVYSKLFGSAEALRALIPIQGALADDFSQKIEAMSNSAGTMDKAFEEMSGTGESLTIMLQNTVASIMDSVAAITSSVAPFVDYAAAAGEVAGSLINITQGAGLAKKSIVAFMNSSMLATASQKAIAAATAAWAAIQKVLNMTLMGCPLMLIVAGLVALGAAIVDAYNRFEIFRNIVDNIWSLIKTALVPVFDKLGAAIKKAWEWVSKLFGFNNKDVNIKVKTKTDKGSGGKMTTGSAGSIKTGAKSSGANKGAPIGSLSALDENIKTVQQKIDFEINPQKRAELYKELENLKNQKVVIEAKMQLDAEGFEADTEKLSMKLENTLDRDISKGGLKDVNAMIKQSNKAVKAQESLTKAEEKRQEAQMNGYEVTQLTAQSFGQMGEAIGGAGGQMVQWAAQQVAAIAAVIPQIVALITAKEAEATAEATASGSSLPFPANIAAIAAGVATVIATFAKMPKFANGGIISGPTIGLMGEYSGASNNPEVVAPLSKLKSMLGGDEGGIGGKVVFKQRGRDLYGVLARENRFRSRQ